VGPATWPVFRRLSFARRRGACGRPRRSDERDEAAKAIQEEKGTSAERSPLGRKLTRDFFAPSPEWRLLSTEGRKEVPEDENALRRESRMDGANVGSGPSKQGLSRG